MSTAMSITDQILARLSVGDSLRDSVDGVLGEGTYERCALELYATATAFSMDAFMRENGLTREEVALAPPTLALRDAYARTCPHCRRVHTGYCRANPDVQRAAAIHGNDEFATVDF